MTPHHGFTNARYICHLATFCQPGRGRMDLFWRRARVQNLSAAGIGLVLGIPFEPGTVLTVEMMNQDQSFSSQAQVKVVHTRCQGRGQWVTGCTFFQELSTDDLLALLA